jgi:activator of HSP90 ATPase
MINQEIIIQNATVKDIYEVLMNAEKHSLLINDIADIEDLEGTKFSTFGGYAEGENIELKPGKLIKQTWRASDWPENHYSIITFELSNVDGGAKIRFSQDKLPEGTQKEFEAGWADFYWEPLKKYFTVPDK